MLSRAVSSVWEWARILRSSRAVRDSSIVGAVQFATQAIRFLSNIILAALLSPVIFGLMAIVTTIRTGIELLSDVGIGQSIVVSDDGAKQEFVETAWALKIIRGIVLTLRHGLGLPRPRECFLSSILFLYFHGNRLFQIIIKDYLYHLS